jgi:hypothetical protein
MHYAAVAACMELGAWGMEWRGMERRTQSLETTILSFKPQTAVYRERRDIATRIRPFSTVKPTMWWPPHVMLLAAQSMLLLAHVMLLNAHCHLSTD